MEEEIECKTKLTDRRNEMKNKPRPRGYSDRANLPLGEGDVAMTQKGAICSS